jgi:hypothetical protein
LEINHEEKYTFFLANVKKEFFVKKIRQLGKEKYPRQALEYKLTQLRDTFINKTSEALQPLISYFFPPVHILLPHAGVWQPAGKFLLCHAPPSLISMLELILQDVRYSNC